jgi:hypothetical protein
MALLEKRSAHFSRRFVKPIRHPGVVIADWKRYQEDEYHENPDLLSGLDLDRQPFDSRSKDKAYHHTDGGAISSLPEPF